MAIRAGDWVIHDGQVAVVFEITQDNTGAVLHYVDKNGETIMRRAQKGKAHMHLGSGMPHGYPAWHPQAGGEVQEDVCPQTGNPRTHVTLDKVVPWSELRSARNSEIPPSRR